MSSSAERDGVPAYFPALDGMRFFACAAVVVSHCFVVAEMQGVPEWLRRGIGSMGKTGVDVFFALSGFLITKLLLDEKSARGRVDLLAFYMRRTLRIWPVYYVALAVGFGGAALLGDRFCRPLGMACHPRLFTVGLPAHLGFVGNWVEDLVSTPSPIATLWSVCIEEQFYLLFPITFVFSRRRHPVLTSVGVGFVIAWVTRGWLAAHGGAVFHNTFAHADNLLAGALVAQLLHARPRVVTAFFRRAPLAFEALGVAALVAFNEWELDDLHGLGGWLAFYTVSAAITAFLVGTVALGRGPLAAMLSRRSLRFLGQLTYSAYAFHVYGVMVVWVVVRRLALGGFASGVARSILAVPLAMLIAYVCRVTFELRFLKLKQRFAPPVNAAPPPLDKSSVA